VTTRTKLVLAATSERRAAPYVVALSAVGFDEVTVLTADGGRADPEAALADAAGLVLGGGADVDPRRYAEEPRADVELVPERDALEWRLLAGAQERRLPVWGICRGLQTLNVFLGGSLWQDLPSDRPSDVPHDLESPPDRLAHALSVSAPRTAFGRRLAEPGALVNSRHHQGVRQLAPGLLPVATAPDGLIEAVTSADGASGWWARAVQWHPENLLAIPLQRLLWEDFAQAVAQRAALD
jgi:putative glutamine amidotransferase